MRYAGVELKWHLNSVYGNAAYTRTRIFETPCPVTRIKRYDSAFKYRGCIPHVCIAFRNRYDEEIYRGLWYPDAVITPVVVQKVVNGMALRFIRPEIAKAVLKLYNEQLPVLIR